MKLYAMRDTPVPQSNSGQTGERQQAQSALSAGTSGQESAAW